MWWVFWHVKFTKFTMFLLADLSSVRRSPRAWSGTRPWQHWVCVTTDLAVKGLRRGVWWGSPGWGNGEDRVGEKYRSKDRDSLFPLFEITCRWPKRTDEAQSKGVISVELIHFGCHSLADWHFILSVKSKKVVRFVVFEFHWVLSALPSVRPCRRVWSRTRPWGTWIWLTTTLALTGLRLGVWGGWWGWLGIGEINAVLQNWCWECLRWHVSDWSTGWSRQLNSRKQQWHWCALRLMVCECHALSPVRPWPRVWSRIWPWRTWICIPTILAMEGLRLGVWWGRQGWGGWSWGERYRSKDRDRANRRWNSEEKAIQNWCWDAATMYLSDLSEYIRFFSLPSIWDHCTMRPVAVVFDLVLLPETLPWVKEEIPVEPHEAVAEVSRIGNL